MPEKIFTKFFSEDFGGLDLRSTDLSRSAVDFKALTNKEFTDSGSLATRKGFQIVGQSAPGFTRIFTHRFLDPVSGEVKEELLGVNQFLWKLKLGYLTVSGGGGAMNYYVAYNDATNSYRFYLRNGASAYTLSGNPYLDLKTGMEEQNNGAGALVTINDLRAAIVGAGLTCTLTPNKFAIVDTSAGGVIASTAAIPVNAASNTYVAGDWVTYMNADGFFPHMTARRIATVTAGPPNTLDWSTTDFADTTVINGQVLGPSAAAAAGIAARDATTAGGANLYVYFYYWDIIPYTTNLYDHARYNMHSDDFPTPFGHNYYACRKTNINNNWTHPCPVDQNNACYVHTSNFSPTYKSSYDGYPFKYDGQNVFREGLPRPKQLTLANGGAGNVDAGTHKYVLLWQQKDARGNIILSRVSKETSITLGVNSIVTVTYTHPLVMEGARGATTGGAAGPVTVVTVVALTNKLEPKDTIVMSDAVTGTITTRYLTNVNTAGGSNFTISGAGVTHGAAAPIWVCNDTLGFNYKSALTNSAGVQTNVDGSGTALVCLNTAAAPFTLDVGDTFCVRDTRSGLIVRRTITALTFGAGTVNVSFSPSTQQIDVAASSPLTCNLTMLLYRTKAGGNVFYLYDELIPNLFALTNTFNDNTADTGLGAQLIEPEIGKEPDMSPKTAFATAHAGARVAAGDKENPNTVYIYDADNFESVPAAYNAFDVTTAKGSGPLTALASDSDDRLAVFRADCFYDVSGDLQNLAFSIRAVREGDSGVHSQASIDKVEGVIVGVGKHGIVAVKDGALSPELAENINPAIKNNPEIATQWAIGYNNPIKGQYQVHIPDKDFFGYVTGVYGDSLGFVFDVGRSKKWMDREYYIGYEPSGGLTSFAGSTFHCSLNAPDNVTGAANWYSRVFREYDYIASGPDTTTTPETQITKKLFGPLTSAAAMFVDNHLDMFDYCNFLIHLSEPSLDKEFLRFKLFSFFGPYEVQFATGGNVTLKTYRNYQTATVHTNTTLVLPAGGDAEVSTKLLAGKARALEFELSISGVGINAQFSGFEIIISPSYLKEEFIK